jgi:hypothetical protein
MEYVDGQDLARIVHEQGALPVPVALDYVCQVARGCEHAHELGVIHRDIKPANLLVDADGVVKILDMGLARVEFVPSEVPSASQSKLTSTGIIMGTVDYMSPEQALNTRKVDHRSDIYSLGCTLHYLLTGRPVYSGDTPMEKLVAHREHAIPSLRDSRSDVSEVLDSTFTRMVAKDREARFQSMADVVHALQRMPDGRPRSGISEVPEQFAPSSAGESVSPAVPDDSTQSARSMDTREAENSKTGRTWTGWLLALVARVVGAILGCLGGVGIGELLGGMKPLAIALYVWFGWRCGGGYAWMVARGLGWTSPSSENGAGPLFQSTKWKVHAQIILVGGAAGIWTGDVWRGVFLGLTLLAVADHFRERRRRRRAE